MPSFTIQCCIAGCKAVDVHRHRFPNPATDLDRFNTWLEILGCDDLRAMEPAKVYTNRRICSAHFHPKYSSVGNPRLHHNAVPTLDTSVIQEVDGRECAKEPVPSIVNNDTTDNSKESSMPVESNENDLQTQSDMVIEEPEVTSASILFVASSVNYKEDVLKTSNKQPQTDCDPLRKRIVQNPQYTGQCTVEDLESPMTRERNWNLAMNEISTLRKKVNALQSQNRRLDRRVKSMKTLLRHYKKAHA